MRPSRFAFALILGLPGMALAQTAAECEYRNPDFPNWNYLRSCTVTSETAGDRTTTTASVANGSTLTIVEQGGADAPSFRVNGRRATRLENGASRCYLTIEDDETICIHLDGAPLTPVETAAAPEAGEEADLDAAPPVADIADTGFGGGEAGHCLAWATGETTAGLIGKGTCQRRTDCAEIEGEGGMSCLIDIAWESGRETVITRVGGVYTLDGAVAVPTEQGCLIDEGAGLHFCFSEAPMTEAAYPAIALPPATETAPAVAVEAAVTEDEADTASAEPATTESRCSFLRDEVEVSSWRCSETVACEAPLCTVTYAFENGTTVTLDTADGQVMLMNGAKADPAPWAEDEVVDVTRPGAPYTFRFTPGTDPQVEQ